MSQLVRNTESIIRNLALFKDFPPDIVDYQDLGHKAHLCLGCDSPHNNSNKIYLSSIKTSIYLDDNCYDMYADLVSSRMDLEATLSEYIDSKEVTPEMFYWFHEKRFNMCYFCRYDVADEWVGSSKILLPVDQNTVGGYINVCDRCTTLAQVSLGLREPFVVHYKHLDSCIECGKDYPITDEEGNFRYSYKMDRRALCPVCYYKIHNTKNRHYRLNCTGENCKELIFKDRMYDSSIFDMKLSTVLCNTCSNKDRYKVLTEVIEGKTYSAYFLPPINGDTWSIQIYNVPPPRNFSLPPEAPIYGELDIPSDFDAYVTAYSFFAQLKQFNKNK